jgi:hypothetical protein
MGDDMIKSVVGDTLKIHITAATCSCDIDTCVEIKVETSYFCTLKYPIVLLLYSLI